MREIFTRVEDGGIVRIEVFLDAKENMELNPWLFSVFIKYDSYNEEDGLDEFFETKESLIISLEHSKKAVYVGNRIVREWSEIYFYSEDSKGLEAIASDILKTSKYIYECNVVRDNKWEFFDYNIFPNDLELSFMQSQKIIEHLEDEGDNISVARVVEHYASFDTPTQRDRFVKSALDIGFEFKDEISSEEFDFGIALTKKHNLTMDELKIIITPLLELIKHEHGEYELWSTTLELNND